MTFGKGKIQPIILTYDNTCLWKLLFLELFSLIIRSEQLSNGYQSLEGPLSLGTSPSHYLEESFMLWLATLKSLDKN